MDESTDAGRSDRPHELLFVCSGNMCRSPMAAAFARALVKQRGVTVNVRSAGFLTEDAPPPRATLRVTERMGVDISEHRSKKVAQVLATGPDPDLVLVMERQHVRSVVEHDPSLFPRTFTLVEFVRLAKSIGPRRPSEQLDSYLERLSSKRSPSQLLGIATDDELEDPIGRSIRFHSKSAGKIQALVDDVVGLVWP